jgi:hypothetical protein
MDGKLAPILVADAMDLGADQGPVPVIAAGAGRHQMVVVGADREIRLQPARTGVVFACSGRAIGIHACSPHAPVTHNVGGRHEHRPSRRGICPCTGVRPRKTSCAFRRCHSREARKMRRGDLIDRLFDIRPDGGSGTTGIMPTVAAAFAFRRRSRRAIQRAAVAMKRRVVQRSLKLR